MVTMREGKAVWAFGTREMTSDEIHQVAKPLPSDPTQRLYEVHDAAHNVVATLRQALEGVDIKHN